MELLQRRHGVQIGMTMNFEFKCPQCGNAVSVDESYRGQVAECPHCNKGIVIPHSKESAAKVQKPQRPPKTREIKCPYCGASYEIEEHEYGHKAACEVCGKSFVIGETSTALVKVESYAQTTNLPRKTWRLQGENPLRFTLPADYKTWKLHMGLGLSWLLFKKMIFRRWQLFLVRCPACNTDGIVCAPRSSLMSHRECACHSCLSVFTLDVGLKCRMRVEEEWNRQIKAMKSRNEEITEQFERMTMQLEIPKEIKKFERDWNIYTDPIVPKRLQLVLDGLRTRLMHTKLDQVTNAQRSTKASIVAFGTTGDDLGSSIIQLAGLAELSEADREATAIRGKTYDLESELELHEAMMNYYYDLCSEFRGHEKHEALALRIKSKFVVLDESEQVMFNIFTSDDDKIQAKFFQKAKELGKSLEKEQIGLNESISQLQDKIDRPRRFKKGREAKAIAIVILFVVLGVVFGGILFLALWWRNLQS